MTKKYTATPKPKKYTWIYTKPAIITPMEKRRLAKK